MEEALNRLQFPPNLPSCTILGIEAPSISGAISNINKAFGSIWFCQGNKTIG